jgi:hypothetical protein
VPEKPSLAFVAFARISLGEGSLMPSDIAKALHSDLAPGKSVFRYKRLWRLPQHAVRKGWISGRIGFEYPASSAAIWDEAKKDYREIHPAQVTRYVIDTNECRVAFELKGGSIKPWTFQTNFQALLNVESPYQWRVALEELSQPSWEQWQKSVSRITDVRINMERPNPRYPGEQVEDLFENAQLAAATLAVKGDDIELSQSELLKEALALAQDYGHVTARGVASLDGEKQEWRSEEDGGTIDRQRAERDSKGEVPTRSLRALLEKRKSKSAK